MKVWEAKFLRPVGEQDLDATRKVVYLAEVSIETWQLQGKSAVLKDRRTIFLTDASCICYWEVQGKKNSFAWDPDGKIQIYSTKQRGIKTHNLLWN